MDPMRINWFTRIATLLSENSDIPTDITFKFVESNHGEKEVSAQSIDVNGEMSAQSQDGNEEVSAQSDDDDGDAYALSNDRDGEVYAQSNDGDREAAAQSIDGDGEVSAQSIDDRDVSTQSNDDREVAAQSNDGDRVVAAQANDQEVTEQSNYWDREVAAQSIHGDGEVVAQSNDGDREVVAQSTDREDQVSAHKMILALVSPVFRKMFYVHNTVDMFAQEIVMEETTAPAFRIFIEAIYGVTHIQESLKGKSVDEIFAVLYLVTKYDIPELVIAVQDTLSSFPLTVDTVLEVAADVMDYSSTFPEEANQLLLACAKFLKAKLTRAGEVLGLIADNGDKLVVIQQLAALIREITPSECGDSCASLTSDDDSDSEEEIPSLEQAQ